MDGAGRLVDGRPPPITRGTGRPARWRCQLSLGGGADEVPSRHADAFAATAEVRYSVDDCTSFRAFAMSASILPPCFLMLPATITVSTLDTSAQSTTAAT